MATQRVSIEEVSNITRTLNKELENTSLILYQHATAYFEFSGTLSRA